MTPATVFSASSSASSDPEKTASLSSTATIADSLNSSKNFPPVEALLPHSHPMILVDRLVASDDESITAELEIRPNSPLLFDGKVPALVAIEYMAQSIGLLTGYESYKKQSPIQVGYLLGTRDLTMKVDAFHVGDRLTVHALRLFGEDEIGAFQCTVSLNGEDVASATLNVYRDKIHVLPGRP